MAPFPTRSIVFLAIGASAVALEDPSDSCVGEHECGLTDASSMLQLRSSGAHPTEASEAEQKPIVGKDPLEQCGASFTTYPYIQAQLWGTSYDGWEQCAGQQQSPIDLSSHDHPAWAPYIDQKYKSGGPDLRVHNNGHSVQVDGSFGDVVLDGNTLSSKQFHFHHPSEHTINGNAFPLEMHIVNANEAGVLGVIALQFELGAPNACLAKVLSEPVPKAGCDRWVGEVDLSCFEEQLVGPYWSYMGSLTTPPCTEGVAWRVMGLRPTVSKEQVEAMTSRHTMNSRPVQARADHVVTLNYPK